MMRITLMKIKEKIFTKKSQILMPLKYLIKILFFGKKIAVLGQGGIGLSFTMFASKQGAAEVVGIDKHDYRLEKSISIGATKTMKFINLDDLIQKTEDLTNGELFDIVVDASGNKEGFNICLNLLKHLFYI